ncbi:MAG: aminotransferase class I/II-fold pyridoxal phosphate-dependent enzyme [Actinomycetota bacterium]
MPEPSFPIPPAGVHGGDAPAIAAAIGRDPAEMLDLSMSLNPFAPEINDLVSTHAAAAGRYPDPTDATREVAEMLGIEVGRFLLTHGASEAIRLVGTEIGGGALSEPEFGLHPRGAVGPRWRSDPHNPTGEAAGPDLDADVWDEAFLPLSDALWTRGRPGVAIGSFTKVFACPGLRLGYLIADDAERFARHRPAWPMSGIALAVLPDLVRSATLGPWRDAIATQRARLTDLLRSFGLDVDAADAPWVLCGGTDLRDRLARHGVVVRDCTNFGMAGRWRIAVPDDDGMTRLASALEAIA